jgi:hypothetical protein
MFKGGWMLNRREWLRITTTGAAVTLATGTLPACAAPVIPVTVYKAPSCDCCRKWVEHLRSNGFDATTRDLEDLSEVKATFGVPASLQSCHTASVGSYAVEGHVPADAIKRMLREKPKIAGLAVPGMPVGSPGMEGGTPEHYDVVAFEQGGKTSVYARY